MTDSAADDRAASAVGHLMASGRIPAAPGLPLPVGGRVVRGKYTFGQLAAWRDVTFQHITSLPRHEVASLDLDEKANTVTIGVTSLASKGDRDDLIANLVRLGIPERALRLQEDTRGNTVGRSALLVTAREAWSDVRQPPLEMIGGHQVYIVGHGNCTIGFVARRNGVAGFVTASHCTTNQFGADSDSVSYVEGAAVIAKELHDPDDYECGIHSGCRGSDAAFFGPTSATENPPMAVGLIANPISYPLTQGGFVYSDQGYWIVVSEEANNGYVGMPVSKVGKTTGWTSGEIIATCADYWGSIEYVTTCTYRTTLVDDSGDSGAPVFLILNRGNEVMALGTLNNGRVSKLSRIKKRLRGRRSDALVYAEPHPAGPRRNLLDIQRGRGDLPRPELGAGPGRDLLQRLPSGVHRELRRVDPPVLH